MKDRYLVTLAEVIKTITNRNLWSAYLTLKELYQNNPSQFAEIINTPVQINKEYKLVLNVAVIHEDIDDIKFLLAHGADPYQCDGRYRSAISLAEFRPEQRKLIEAYRNEFLEKQTVNANTTSQTPSKELVGQNINDETKNAAQIVSGSRDKSLLQSHSLFGEAELNSQVTLGPCPVVNIINLTPVAKAYDSASPHPASAITLNDFDQAEKNAIDTLKNMQQIHFSRR